MKQFNINSYVKVKLTEEAVKELKRQHDELYESLGITKEFIPPQVDNDGYSKFQLWSLMSSLGYMCKLGFDSPFKECIMLFDDEYLFDYVVNYN